MITILKLKLMKLRDEIKLIGLMTALTLVMIAVFSSINYSMDVTVFGFIDEDNTEISKLLFDELNLQKGYRFDKYTIEEGKNAVKDGDVSGAFYIKENFMSNALNNNEISIDRLLISENMNSIQMNSLIISAINNVVTNYKLSFSLSEIIVEYNDSPKEEITNFVYDTINEHWNYKKPIEVNELNVNKTPGYDSVKHSVIGFSLFFAMFTIIFGISEILTEKENHTWNRQMVSPISSFSILMGNLISTFCIGFVQVSLMFVVSKYLFNVDWQGSMTHTLIIIAAFVFCVTSLGLFLANFVNTIGQLSAITPIIITGTAMLGGCFWPLEIINSKFMLLLANITPQKWAISSIKSIVVYGYGFEEAAMGVFVLIGMGIIYISAGAFLLNKKST